MNSRMACGPQSFFNNSTLAHSESKVSAVENPKIHVFQQNLKKLLNIIFENTSKLLHGFFPKLLSKF